MSEKVLKFSPVQYKYVNGNKLIRREKKDYDRLWRHFTKHEAKEYEEYTGYSIEDIKKVGIRKFIDANDWFYNSDIKKYKTDINKVVICPECKKEFATFPDGLGLCTKCIEMFDLDKFDAAVASTDTDIGKMDMTVLFAFDAEVRNTFKKVIE